MASWADKTPQFNPYVQQLPVEAMVQVGREKQQRYDQGIQRIQSQIDNIAGIDVVRDVDKNYLQSKMNTLGNNLKTVAAGDFSNYQLVNSVGGMINEVSKDRNIENAVYSTENHKKQMQAMEDARRKGTLAPENEYDYQKRFNVYYNSGQLGEQFTHKYTPYVDVNKKIIEIAKEVGIDESVAQQLFQTDASGRILTDANGLPKYNPVMVEQHLKGKDPAKILTAFKSALTPADYNQLAITGRYVKGQQSPEQLAEEIKNNYSQNITLTNGKIEEIKLNLLKEQGKNVKDEQTLANIASLTEQQKYFENQRFELESARERDINEIDKNPDAVRANLYTTNYLAGMSRTLATSTKEVLNKVNPQFETNMRLNEFARQVQQDKIANEHWAIDKMQRDKEFLYKQQNDAANRALKEKEFEAKYGPGPDNAIKEGLSISDNKYEIVNRVNEDFVAGVTELNGLNNQLAIEWFKKTNPVAPGERPEQYRIRLTKKLEEAAANEGKDIESYVTELAAKQVQDWTVAKDSIPFEFRALVSHQKDLSKSLSIQQARMQDIKAQAKAQARAEGALSYDEIRAQIKPLTINTEFGNVTLSPDDMISLVRLRPQVFNLTGHIGIDAQDTRDREKARESLVRKYGEEKLASIEEVAYNLIGIKSLQVSVGALGPLRRTAKMLEDSDFQKAAEIEAKLYIDEGYLQQPISYALARGKQNEDDFNKRVAAIISTYSGVSDTKDLLKNVIGGKPYGAKVTASPGASDRQPVNYTLTVTTPGGEDLNIVIDKDKFKYLSGHEGPINTGKPEILKQLDHFKTTGLDGTDDPKSAWFSDNDFSNLKDVDYNATANFVADQSDPNMLWFKVYVHNKDGSLTTLTYDKPVPKYVEGAYNQALDKFSLVVNSSFIEQLKKQK